MRRQEAVQRFVMITFATVIAAVAALFFLIPSHISVGSIPGLAIVLGSSIPLKISAIISIPSILLLVLDFLFIGKEFGPKTVYTSSLFPVVLTVFELTFSGGQFVTNDVSLDMLCYIFMVSVGLAMLSSRNISSGGLDIVAKLLNKYLHMKLGKAMSLAGMCVVLSSTLVCDKKIVMLSVLGTYLNGIALDHFILGSNIRKRVCIISECKEEIKEFTPHRLRSGAAIYGAIGAYGKEPGREIITIVDKNEYSILMTFVLKTNKDAFVTVYTVNEIIYRPEC